jgi:hypothetical protein
LLSVANDPELGIYKAVKSGPSGNGNHVISLITTFTAPAQCYDRSQLIGNVLGQYIETIFAGKYF